MLTPEDLIKELLQTFQAEAAEHLQTLNVSLLSLEAKPDNQHRQSLLQEAFRAAHSLKGAARAVDLGQIETLAYAMENVLQEARDHDTVPPPAAFDTLYDILDGIGSVLEGQTVEIEPIIDRLKSRVASAGDTSTLTPAESKTALPIPEAAPALSPTANGHQAIPVEDQSKAKVALAEPDKPAVAIAAPEETAPTTLASGEETIRVSIAKLDNLMAQVGELIVSRMNADQRAVEMQELRYGFAGWPKIWREIKALLPPVEGESGKRLAELLAQYEMQFEATSQEISHFDQRLRQDSLRLGIIASQIQDSVRHVRMVPFDVIVPGLQRVVRDAAHSENKQVIFSVIGGDVELDKKVLEALKDPFLHLLRNAVSHGIESPEKRQKLGKTAEGHVTLSLQQRGSEVRITVSDDGAGFDLSGLRQAAKKNHLSEIDDRSSEEDIIGLAFLPGLTTARQVSAISGRGVGLDVVREQLEALQGQIEVESVTGSGASIHLQVPVSLTISRGLLVQVNDERYILPLLSVEKIIEVHQTFMLQGKMMITVDGVSLPLVTLASLLERPASTQGSENPLAVIMAVADQRLALLVDDVVTELELAVKPLGKPLHRVRNVAGAALMGDGKPVVILNAVDLLRTAKGLTHRIIIHATVATQEKKGASILVVDDSITTRTLEKNILETAGYLVTTATNGEQALQRLKEQPFDLVVSDVEMPAMDGITLTKRLREMTEFRDLPLILVTSLESPNDRERGMVAGANAYIVKRGFDQAELLKTIQRLVFSEDADNASQSSVGGRKSGRASALVADH